MFMEVICRSWNCYLADRFVGSKNLSLQNSCEKVFVIFLGIWSFLHVGKKYQCKQLCFHPVSFQEAMMDHALQMISYIADIGKIVVLMARRKQKGHEGDSASTGSQKKCTMICHVFSSEDVRQSDGRFLIMFVFWSLRCSCFLSMAALTCASTPGGAYLQVSI